MNHQNIMEKSINDLFTDSKNIVNEVAEYNFNNLCNSLISEILKNSNYKSHFLNINESLKKIISKFRKVLTTEIYSAIKNETGKYVRKYNLLFKFNEINLEPVWTHIHSVIDGFIVKFLKGFRKFIEAEVLVVSEFTMDSMVLIYEKLSLNKNNIFNNKLKTLSHMNLIRAYSLCALFINDFFNERSFIVSNSELSNGLEVNEVNLFELTKKQLKKTKKKDILWKWNKRKKKFEGYPPSNFGIREFVFPMRYKNERFTT